MSLTVITAKNPEEIEFTLTTTFTLKDWIAISSNFSNEYKHPASELVDDINSMVSQAKRDFYPKPKGEH